MLIYKDILENKIEKNEYSKKEIKFFNKIIVIEEEMYQIEMLDRMTFFDLNY